ncbi:hypothetical protein LTR56_011281 [Elasticomyces elasticus]|nr:hypothetical protein LTR56_011281 [Elasticomyces elasticus]KAK3668354.1 hypothetical protein LTR22_000645 [Elasticomyces elasticus]KAK4911031.1 hypothetical protein LTR49_020392 [Elasticomyces elasticus]KAK5756505.1 hypothetical protein LTS12_013459 [Elasticomyces elasticus]
MATNFAPYQSSPPESERAKSPPPLRSPTASPKPGQPHRNISSIEDPWAAARAQRLPSPSHYTDDDDESTPASANKGGYQDIESQRFRNDYIGQTALAGAGPTYNTGSLGNVFETSLGMPLALEALLAYMLLTVDLLLIGWLSFGAWRNSETLDRVEVPFFGRLASSFVDDE